MDKLLGGGGDVLDPLITWTIDHWVYGWIGGERNVMETWRHICLSVPALDKVGFILCLPMFRLSCFSNESNITGEWEQDNHGKLSWGISELLLWHYICFMLSVKACLSLICFIVITFVCCLSHWATQIVSSGFLFVVVWLSTCWLNHCACMDVSRLHLQQLVNLPSGTA